MSKPEFIYVTFIETTPDKLWHALTDADFTERYWFNHRLTSDWQIGSAFSLALPRADRRLPAAIADRPTN